MLDVHANSSGGGTTLTAISTISLGGDGQTVAGVPIAPGAILAGYGSLTTIADTIREQQLISQDQVDPINGEYFTLGTSSLIGILHKHTFLPYRTGVRTISQRQNTAGANNLAYYMDYYSPEGRLKYRPQFLSFNAPRQINLSTTSGALTAITWGATAFNPTNAIPNGVYGILGAYANALTNYAVIRFAHADFGVFKPGFPIIDQTNTAVANAVLPKDFFLNYQGYQFVQFSRMFGRPCVPLFGVTNAGTGLRFEVNSITADTPVITLNLAKVSDLGRESNIG